MSSRLSSMKPLLIARGVSKRFGAVEALVDALGVVQTAQVLALIEHLREQGLAIVVISHNLDNVFHMADRISVLRLGRHLATFDRRTTPRKDVVAAITGALPAAAVAA